MLDRVHRRAAVEKVTEPCSSIMPTLILMPRVVFEPTRPKEMTRLIALMSARSDSRILQTASVRRSYMDDQAKWEASVDGSVGLIRVHLTGLFSINDWWSVLKSLPDLAGFRPGMPSIYDARRASFDFSVDDVRRLVAGIPDHLNRRGTGFRAAFVVGTDVDYGVSRMIQGLTDGLPFEATTFRSLEDAEKWVLSPSDGAL